MSGPFLELRGGHMRVFQVNGFQVTFVKQFVGIVSEWFIFGLCPKSMSFSANHQIDAGKTCDLFVFLF